MIPIVLPDGTTIQALTAEAIRMYLDLGTQLKSYFVDADYKPINIMVDREHVFRALNATYVEDGKHRTDALWGRMCAVDAGSRLPLMCTACGGVANRDLHSPRHNRHRDGEYFLALDVLANREHFTTGGVDQAGYSARWDYGILCDVIEEQLSG